MHCLELCLLKKQPVYIDYGKFHQVAANFWRPKRVFKERDEVACHRLPLRKPQKQLSSTEVLPVTHLFFRLSAKPI